MESSLFNDSVCFILNINLFTHTLSNRLPFFISHSQHIYIFTIFCKPEWGMYPGNLNRYCWITCPKLTVKK